MSEHLATIEWSRDGQVFTDNQYARAHDWRFDGGAVVRGSIRRWPGVRSSDSPRIVR